MSRTRLFSRFAFAALTAFALACGEQHDSFADGGVADAGGTPDDAPLTVPGPLCRDVCARAQPKDVTATYPCTVAELSSCEQSCARAVEDTDAVCGACLAESISWLAPHGGCNARECVCLEGFPTFSDPRSSDCQALCAPTLQRQADARLREPVPEVVGHRPAAQVELPELWNIGFLSPHGSGAWLATTHERGSVAAHVDGELKLDWVSDPDAASGTFSSVTTAAGGDGLFLSSGFDAKDDALLRISPRGELVFRRALSGPSRYARLAPMAEGQLLLLGQDNSMALLAASDGSLIEQLPARPPFDGANSALYALAVDAQDHLALGGYDATRAVLAWFDDWRGQPRFEHFLSEPAAATDKVQVSAVAIDARGFTALGGHVYLTKTLPGGTRRSHPEPFVARVSPAGELVWRWQFDAATVVDGEVRGVAVDAAGNVFSVGTEDPVLDSENQGGSDACSVYGCEGLVVRKFSPEGALRWEYQHRSARSKGFAIAVDGEGRVLAAGGVQREEAAGILLRFSPD